MKLTQFSIRDPIVLGILEVRLAPFGSVVVQGQDQLADGDRVTATAAL